MPTRFVTIQNKVYQFDYDYKNTDFRREALNRMTKETWGFSFERWYQNGFWPDSCMPYSLFDLQKMVSMSPQRFSPLHWKEKRSKHSSLAQ